MFELKRLSEDAIPAALERALRYRLLNEPAEAESICHDVLRIDPENQEALVLLLLALTDRFGKSWFEKAEALRPARNDDALLHWNTCARIIMGNQLTPRPVEMVELPLE